MGFSFLRCFLVDFYKGKIIQTDKVLLLRIVVFIGLLILE